MTKLPLWLKVVLFAIPGLLLAAAFVLVAVGWWVSRQMQDSGGVLPPAMAAVDVRHYDLELRVDPNSRSLSGRNTVTVEASAAVERFEIHLDGRLEVASVAVDGEPATHTHRDGVISVGLDAPWRPGSRHRVEIAYGGRPKRALRAPWINGFVWSETESGEPWIGVASEGDGGDNWWPCKDHPSDEPDEGMDIALTVPGDLVGLANGRRVGEIRNPDGTVTTRWRVSFPINGYGVSVNIGPYVPVETVYRGVDGTLDEIVTFWALPESADDARALVETVPDMLAALGRRFGDYPFLADGLAIVHAPFLGMEHQTLIAYGGDFAPDPSGFDALLLHELAHEWWGNKVTAAEWGDIWLHEGFASYSEALYALDTSGEDGYLAHMQKMRDRMSNRVPLVQGPGLTANEAFLPDAYGKGAWVLHMLRLLLGPEALDEVLWRFADGGNPGACRLVTTDEFTRLVEEVVDTDLDWFWQRYLHTAELPYWQLRRTSGGDRDTVRIRWNDPSFEMPLPVAVDGDRRVVAMPGGMAELTVEPGAEIVVDPRAEVLTAAH